MKRRLAGPTDSAGRTSAFALLVLALLLLPSVALADEDARLLRYFTEKEIAEREAFAFPLRMNWLVDQALGIVLLIGYLGLRWNVRLKAWADRLTERIAARIPAQGPLSRVGATLDRLWGDSTWAGALIFGLAFVGINELLGMPQHFYFGWYYQRVHGVSVEPIGRFIWDLLKSELVTVITFSTLIFGLYGLARKLPRWPLVLGIPCAVLLLGAGMLDPYRTRLYFDYVPMPPGETQEKLKALLEQAGVEYEGLYVLKVHDISRRVNAFLEGEGPTRRIVLWDTMLTTMTPDEITNAVAHELGHLKDRSASRPLMASAAVVPFLLGMSWLLRRLGRSGRFGFDSDRDVRSLPAALALIWAISMTVAPLTNAYSRQRELAADRYALELLNQPEELRSLMVKLARVNMANLKPPLWSSVLLASHPRVIDRIEAIEAYAAEKGIALADPTPELFRTPEAKSPTEHLADQKQD